MAQPKPEPASSAQPQSAAVRFGCSSFSSEDWVGPFYPAGTRPGEFLRLYAEHFDTVEVDATYYAVPRASVVDGWKAKTPEGFLLSAKFPRSIVHGGEGPMPDGDTVLLPDATYDERDRFLEVMSRLGTRTPRAAVPLFQQEGLRGPRALPRSSGPLPR